MALLRFLELMRYLTAPLLFFVLFFLTSDSEEVRRPVRASAIRVHARPITPDRFIIGTAPGLPLAVTGAWHLTSNNPDFGGLSALHVSGGALTMVSDKGALVRLGVDAASQEWEGTVSPLPSKCGASSQSDNNDTESLVSDQRTGALWIGFESRNVICRIADVAAGGSSRGPIRPLRGRPRPLPGCSLLDLVPRTKSRLRRRRSRFRVCAALLLRPE